MRLTLFNPTPKEPFQNGFVFYFSRTKIPCLPEKAWDLLTDTTRWSLWGPSVRSVSCSDRYIRLGSQGWIITAIGLRVPFRITEYEHGSYWTWDVAGIPATGHCLISLSTTACKIAFTMPIYWLPYAFICRIALKRMARILCETGSGQRIIRGEVP